MTTTINMGNPLFNTRHEKLRMDAVLRHLGSGADLRDFSGSPSEKVALVKTANQRGLITWDKALGRYALTSAGWCALAPNRRFGVGSMMLGTTVGATLGAAALAVFWFTAGPAQRPGAPRSVLAAAQAKVAKAPAPAVTGAVSSQAPVAPTSMTTAGGPAVPVAAPIQPEPTKAAHQPTPEERAEAAAKARHAAAVRRQAIAAKREKARQRAAARRKREDAARNWAANGPGSRQADYSGNSGYGGYGGRNPWYAYR